ncbi:DoxX family protein [Roseibacterium beibuensis]|uniref:DoxX family protein n=1 Tax=[Roseibacterium] beibuensis TaxID=1193142 RepID=UPI00217ED030|nr:DoxX family protein [Roseibacterium beibuensis]MCS6625259.1 DoxX family protein [Roseibacterium beibuensis]
MFDRFTAYQPQLLSVLRIVTGLLFVSHGTAKVLGFPAMDGMPEPGLSLAGLSGPLELLLGALFLIGLFTRPVAFLASGFCAVGYWAVHGTQAAIPLVNGGETIALYCFVFLYFVAAGPGPWSADAMMKRR